MLTRISLNAFVFTKSTFLYTVLLLWLFAPPFAKLALGTELLLLLLWCCSWFPLLNGSTALWTALALLGGMFQVAGEEWLVLANDESEVPCEDEPPAPLAAESSGVRGLCELVDSDDSRSKSRY